MSSKGIAGYWVDDDFSELGRPSLWTVAPEHRLLMAIVERAARDATGINRQYAESAFNWFLENKNKEPQIFSFRWICETLEVDRRWMVNHIKRIIEQKNQTDTPEKSLPIAA